MANVKIIPADPHRTKSKACIEETPKLRVAAYCRVSTDTDEQATSYETRWSTIPSTSAIILNGLLRGSMPMTASPAPTQRTEPSLTE